MLTKSSTETVRQQNRAILLSVVRRLGRLSHTEIAEATGLSSATVSAITAELEAERVLERCEIRPGGGRGRPRILFEQRRDCGYVALVRISSDVVQYSLADYAGTLKDRFEETRPQPDRGVDVFAAGLRAALDRLVSRSRLSREQLLAVSISSKGFVAAGEPVLLWSPVFGDARLDFRKALSPPFSERILVSNETLLVATAQHQRMMREGRPGGVAVLSLGHSIGLGIARPSPAGDVAHAPNFGHMVHRPGGALCRCGSKGCIEAYAGFYAILRSAFEVPENTLPAKFVPLAEVDKIAARARGGDRMAGRAFRLAGEALGIGLARMFTLHERMPVLVTGPGARYFDLLETGLRDGLGQSLAIRIEGKPEIFLSFDEESLVFEGNLQKTLTGLDRNLFATRSPQGSET